MLEDLVQIVVPLGLCVALPCIIVWLVLRKKINDTNQRTQVLLAAIEKQGDIDVEEFLKKMEPAKPLLKVKLLNRLLWGCICSLIGLGLTVTAIFMIQLKDELMALLIPSLSFLAVGIAFLINYFVGKKMLRKELETEAQKG